MVTGSQSRVWSGPYNNPCHYQMSTQNLWLSQCTNDSGESTTCCRWTDQFKGTYGIYLKPRGPVRTRDWEPVIITLQETLMGGKGGAGPSSHHTRVEGPTEYVNNARWMCFMVTGTIFKNHHSEVGLTHKTKRPWHSENSQPLVYSILSCIRNCKNKTLRSHTDYAQKYPQTLQYTSKIGENRRLVTNEPVEFEKYPVEVHQDCRKLTDHFRGICIIFPNLMKENQRMSTSNQLDLQTLGSQPVIMPTNLPDHRCT